MSDIIIYLKDGTKHEFFHVGRASGSYSLSVRYENGFAIVTDEYYNETAFPSENILKIEKRENMW